MGKVIYFFSAPIGMVMFPLIVQKHSKNENYTNIFMLSLLLILLPSVGLTILYFLFPAFIIHIFNKQYLSMTPLLGIFALFISLYSILTILTNFFLSIKKTKVYIPIVTGAIFQAISLWFFHKDFLQIILLSIFSVAVPLAILFLYYWRLSSRVGLSVPAEIVSPPLSGGSQ